MSLEHTQEYLSFALGGLEYGLDARQVRELCPFDALGRIADDDAVVPGVASKRGVIMPLVDLRAAVAGRPLPCAPHNDVIILELAQCTIGMVVDAVHGVVALRPDQVGPLPCTDGAAPADYLLGLGSDGARCLILVDIARLMAVGQHKIDCLV